MKHALLLATLLFGCTAGFRAGGFRGPAISAPPPPSSAPAEASYEAPDEAPYEAAPTNGPELAAPAPTRPSPPGQWTLAEKEYWINLHEELDAYVAKTNEQCGSQISATFAHESFRGRMTAGGSYGLDLTTRAMCGAMANSLIEVCLGSATAKQAVATKVHQLVCGYGPARYSINRGVFGAAINTASETKDTHYNAMLAVIRNSL